MRPARPAIDASDGAFCERRAVAAGWNRIGECDDEGIAGYGRHGTNAIIPNDAGEPLEITRAGQAAAKQISMEWAPGPGGIDLRMR